MKAYAVYANKKSGRRFIMADSKFQYYVFLDKKSAKEYVNNSNHKNLTIEKIYMLEETQG